MASKKHTVITHPLARSEQLLVEAVGNETVIFDRDTRATHALKPLAAAVYMYSDGKNTLAEIAELSSYRLQTTVSEAEVSEAVEQLGALNLLEAPGLNTRSGLSRRDALKTFAAVGAGAALISTVTASSALAATSAEQTALGDDQTCNDSDGGASTIIPTAGTYENYIFPAPTTTSVKEGSTTYNFSSPPSGFTSNSAATYGYSTDPAGLTGTYPGYSSDHYDTYAVNPDLYGTACTYVSYSSSDGGTYAYAKGEWQCIPCDGASDEGSYQCCRVVCGPTKVVSGATVPALGFAWGYDADGTGSATSAGYPGNYYGSGTNTNGTQGPLVGAPDYGPTGYYGKYCTAEGGHPTSG